MTIARSRLVDPEVTRWYHCISKCVRQAFLLDGQGRTDRKAWLENRLEELSQVFSISVAGFSILDNHLHVLVRLDPEIAEAWSDEEVVRRWGQLFPPRDRSRKKGPVTDEWIRAKVQDGKWIGKRRKRLQSLSWFMKCLKEPLARLANSEDGCEGAFFASRFKSIGLLDVFALVLASVYIDLNPLAAGIASLPEQSPYTSITRRVEHAWPKMTPADLEAALQGLTLADLPAGDVEQDHWLCPLDDRRQQGAGREGMLPGFSLPKYLLLVNHSATLFREGKARLTSDVAPIFERLGTTTEIWEQSLTKLSARFVSRKAPGRFLAGTRTLLAAAAQRLGLHHLVNLCGQI
jgi:hypothetical protein